MLRTNIQKTTKENKKCIPVMIINYNESRDTKTAPLPHHIHTIRERNVPRRDCPIQQGSKSGGGTTLFYSQPILIAVSVFNSFLKKHISGILLTGIFRGPKTILPKKQGSKSKSEFG
jgi:hypothetical protein